MQLSLTLLEKCFAQKAPPGHCFEDSLQNYSEVSTDTRTLQKGSIFVAIQGEKFDGHTYLETALLKGASVLIIEQKSAEQNLTTLQTLRTQFPNAWIIQVSSTLQAIRKLAQEYRTQMNFPLLAVGGSVGKTTTKELLTSIFKTRFKTHTTKGSENGFLGIALTLLRTPLDTELSIIEVGIDEPGAMIQHCELLKPTHAVLTAIGPEHLEKLQNIETVTKEECILLNETLISGGIAYRNLFDPILKAVELALSTEKSISISEPKNLYLYPLPGEHNIQNAKIAASIAEHFGLSASDIQKGFDTFIPAFGRTEMIQLSPKLKVICDYYNANPSSMKASLEMSSQIAKKENSDLFVVLGDMKELGEQERMYHEELAPLLTTHQPHSIYLYGERMHWLHQLLPQSIHSNDLQTLSISLKNKLSSHFKTATLLIKGSRSMKMERVLECLQTP